MQYEKMRQKINDIAVNIQDTKTKEMFFRCFYNTLETTVKYLDDQKTYVITGDIPALWLRDSSVQVTGYLPFTTIDEDAQNMVKGLIKQQLEFIVLDPYANAFNDTPHPHRHIDETDFIHENVWERKFELDSLCYPLWLITKYYNLSQDQSVFDAKFYSAYKIILDVLETEQSHDEKSKYYFRRHGEYSADTLDNDGKGAKTGYTGMVWSGFRPSDDKCMYHYLVPANQMAAAVLKSLAKILKNLGAENSFIVRTEKIYKEIESGIEKYGTINHEKYGKIYAYETDGLGNYNLMDDANVPSLLSLPYLGYCEKDDPVYLNTRRFILSADNPYYYSGKCADGVGSPHTPKGYIWHIAIVIRLLTSTDKKEREECFETLKNTDGGTGFMHESFDANDPKIYTREWFAWANTLFSLAVIDMLKNKD